MTTPTLTLRAYQDAERVIGHERERTALVVHGVITLLVSALVVFLNVTVAPEFPWSPFPVVGMSIGLAAHWWFGYQKLDEQLRNQQRVIEDRAVQVH